MLDPLVESPIVLSLICGLIAALLVSPGYLAALTPRLAVTAPIPRKFPVKSFTRAAMIAFVVLINASSLFLAHRFPLGTDLIVAGFLLLLFAPADEPEVHG